MLPLDCTGLDRIKALPRRQWSREDLAQLSSAMTEEYKTARGTMRLFDVQAQILAELRRVGGVYTSLPVGGGKTLVSALAPTVLGRRNPALFIPANLKSKTHKDFEELRQHWQIPRVYPVLSYELLQHPKRRDMLMDRRFDMLIFDEVHMLKTTGDVLGPRASRVVEYLTKYPDTAVVALTGTPMRTSLMDFWMHVAWALKRRAPLPMQQWVAEQWAEALDTESDVERDCRPLLTLADGSEQGDMRERTVQAVQKRMAQSWGFINVPGMSCEQPIELNWIESLNIPDDILDAIKQVEATGETLNGEILESPALVEDYKRQLLCGFFYLWDPAPPKAWLDARRAWGYYVRDELATGGYADSPALVAAANPEHPALRRWREIANNFDAEANRKVAWLSKYLVRDVKQRAEFPTIVWTEYREVGKAIAQEGGWSYYGAGARGILKEDGSKTIVASIPAHHIGKNLQKFNRNIIVNVPSSATVWEQLIGRTHRQGQDKTVTIDAYTHHYALKYDRHRALTRAEYDQQMMGQPQKLLYAQRTTT